MTTLDPWETANPHRALRFHGTRQQYAGSQIARCHQSQFVRFLHGKDQLPTYQAIQADAFNKMTALRRLLDNAP